MNQKLRQPMNFDASKPVWQSQQMDSGSPVRVSVRTHQMPVTPLKQDHTPSARLSRPESPTLTLKPQAGSTLSRETITEQIKNFFQQ